MYKSHRYNTGGFLFSLTYKHKKKSDKPVQLFRASCRIRTNDPEITNHVLWPTELKRRVGKLTISRRYNQLPLLRSSPGGFEGSWPYGTYPCLLLPRYQTCACFSIAGAKVDISFESAIPSAKKLLFFHRKHVFFGFFIPTTSEKTYFCMHKLNHRT